VEIDEENVRKEPENINQNPEKINTDPNKYFHSCKKKIFIYLFTKPTSRSKIDPT